MHWHRPAPAGRLLDRKASDATTRVAEHIWEGPGPCWTRPVVRSIRGSESLRSVLSLRGSYRQHLQARSPPTRVKDARDRGAGHDHHRSSAPPRVAPESELERKSARGLGYSAPCGWCRQQSCDEGGRGSARRACFCGCPAFGWALAHEGGGGSRESWLSSGPAWQTV